MGQKLKKKECLKDGDRKGVAEEGVKDFVEQTVQDQLLRSESRKYMKRPEAITELQYWYILDSVKFQEMELSYLLIGRTR
eukprot:UN03635